MSFWNSHSEKQKETGKGVLKVIGEYQLSSELQQFVDEENEKVSKDRKRSKIKCTSGHKHPKGYSIPRELPV